MTERQWMYGKVYVDDDS